MKKRFQRFVATIVPLTLMFSMVGGFVTSAAASYPDDMATYKVTIQNLTGGQPLTPPLIVTHRGSFGLFRPGRPASHEIQQIAENGNAGPMIDLFTDNPKVHEFKAAEAPLVPGSNPGGTDFGNSVTLMIAADSRARYLSFASMLICTNDGFTGLSRALLPRSGSKVFLVHAYDAGTEINTEDLADMVPPCPPLTGVDSDVPGTGESNPALAEGGVISHHDGIMGIADLDPDIHGWDTDAPVAKVTVTRVSEDARGFQAPLSGAGELVVQDDGNITTVDSSASGRAWFWLDRSESALRYYVWVRKIDNVVAAHIHKGSASANCPVEAILFSGGPTGRENGRLANGVIRAEDLSSLSFNEFVSELRSGGLYVNVHTSDLPSGEIRGQIGTLGK